MHNMVVPYWLLADITVFKYISLYWIFSFACSVPLLLYLYTFYVHSNLVFKHTNNLITLLNVICNKSQIEYPFVIL